MSNENQVAEQAAPTTEAQPYDNLAGMYIPAREAAALIALLRKVASSLALAGAYAADGQDDKAQEILERAMPVMSISSIAEQALFAQAQTLDELNNPTVPVQAEETVNNG